MVSASSGLPRGFRWLSILFMACAATSCIVVALPTGPTATPEERRTVTRQSFVDANGRRLSFLRGGTEGAPRVIYVHGTPGDAASWMDFIARPIEGTESFAIDRPGFGRSLRTGAVPSLKEQSDALEPLLVAKRGMKPILVGHSLGGPIIARAAADFPDRVGGLVIVSGSMDPGLEETLWIQHIARAPLVRGIVPQVLENTNEELLPLAGELRELAALLPRIQCPVYIIHGDKDGLVPYSNVRFMQDQLPAGSIVHVETLAGANHFVPWEHPGAIRQGVSELLGSAGLR